MIPMLAYLVVVGALVALGARAGEELLRLAGRPLRWVWALGLVLLVGLGAVAPFRELATSQVVLPVTATEVTSAAPAMADDASPLAAMIAAAGAARMAIVSAPTRLASLAPALTTPAAARTIALTWLTMSLTLALLLVATLLRFRRNALRLPRATLHGVPVRVSPDRGPVVVGLAAPVVVVPHWLLAASEEEQQLAVVHETEHVASRDHLLLLAGCTAVMLLPWHPAAWWMLARLRLALEMDCDARVIARGVPRCLYGTALVDIAARGARHPLGVPALADHATHLERRLVAMTPAPIAHRRSRILAVGAAALITVLAACEARLPSAPEIEAMDARAVEQSGIAKRAVGVDSTAAYTIDGRAATRAQAAALTGEQIASIQVRKAPAAGMRSTIAITTRAAADARFGTVMSSMAARVASGEVTSINPTVLVSAGTPGAPVDTFNARVMSMRGHDLAGTRKTGMRDFNGIVYIDGVRSDATALGKLLPDHIDSIEVLKGSVAVKESSEPAAANGIIRVKTRR